MVLPVAVGMVMIAEEHRDALVAQQSQSFTAAGSLMQFPVSLGEDLPKSNAISGQKTDC
jgi:hypothetical protein